jgi:hypothetical protein
VGVRLKGGVGSFRPLSAKAGFKIKFNELVKGQKLLGLKKLTLNNMVQDHSMVHETLAYRTFRAVGVPASRTGYAFVRVNGEPYGLYLNLETLDDVALARWFGAFDDPQHLYEGEYGTDVTPGGAGAFAVDEGDEEDRADLEALIAAANGEHDDWSEGMTGVADLGEMTQMWAVERYLGHWDGYAGAAGPLWPNNFYLYADAVGEFQMLPWGTDQTWHVRSPFAADSSLLFDSCLADASCVSMYRAALVQVRESVGTMELSAFAESTAELLAPWQALDPRREYSEDQIAAGVRATRDFIDDRPAELRSWLSGDPGGAPPGPAAADPGRSPSTALPAMRVGQSAVIGGALVTDLDLAAAGRIRQRAAIRTKNGTAKVCSVSAQETQGGKVLLRCRLSAAAMRRLRARWLTIRVETRFTSTKAGPELLVWERIARRVG